MLSDPSSAEGWNSGGRVNGGEIVEADDDVVDDSKPFAGADEDEEDVPGRSIEDGGIGLGVRERVTII